MAIILTIQPSDDIQNFLNILDSYGGGILYLNPTDIYYPGQDVVLPSNVTLNGNGGIIDFQNSPYGILSQGSDAYADGTMSINFGSSTVTGTGTAWTSDMAGQSILIGDYWYEISSVEAADSLTIASTMLGVSLTNDTYVIATTIDGTAIENMTVQNSSASLVKGRYSNGVAMDGVVTVSGDKGFDFADCAFVNNLNFGTDSCTTNGLVYNNVPLCTLSNFSMLNGGGISMTRVTNTTMEIMSVQGITGNGISMTDCSNFALQAYYLSHCTGNGMEFISGNESIDIISGLADNCGGDGLKITANSDALCFSNNTITDCTGYGINVADASCLNSVFSVSVTSNNTAGAIHDLGTGTVAPATINIFN